MQEFVLAALVCACGSTKIIAIEPGKAPLIWRNLTVTRDVKPKGWCMACCVRRGWLAEAA